MLHYKMGEGAQYNLTDEEFKMASIDNYRLDGDDFQNKFSNIAEGSTKFMSFGILVGTKQSATTGTATMVDTGNLSKINGLPYFTGTMQLVDTYDFDLRLDSGLNNNILTALGQIANGIGNYFEIRSKAYEISIKPFEVIKPPKIKSTNINGF